jgi:hypothetical protein
MNDREYVRLRGEARYLTESAAKTALNGALDNYKAKQESPSSYGLASVVEGLKINVRVSLTITDAKESNE